MIASPAKKKRKISYETHTVIVERLIDHIDEQQKEIEELQKDIYKLKYGSLHIKIPKTNYSTEDWSPVSPSYSGASPQSENYPEELNGNFMDKPEAPYGYTYEWQDDNDMNNGYWKLEPNDASATVIQKMWRGYKIRKPTCKHSWVIERGIFGDHTIKYCVDCHEEDRSV